MSVDRHHSRTSSVSILVVMPAYNEAANIGAVLRELRRRYRYPVVVVDDASTDDTAAIASQCGATVISLPVQLGAWGATQTGLRYAIRHGYAVAVSMDSDGQHDCHSLPLLLAPVLDGSADLAIGACTARGSWPRQVAWHMMRRVSGLTLDDITSGFRAYNRHAIEVLASWRATLLDYQDIGVLLLVQSHGLQVVDIEVPMQARTSGKSRIFHSWVVVAYYMCHTLLLGFSKRPGARRNRVNG